jgi:hypothetical protein
MKTNTLFKDDANPKIVYRETPNIHLLDLLHIL